MCSWDSKHVYVFDMLCFSFLGTGYSRYCRQEKNCGGCTRSDEFYNEKTLHMEVTKCYCDTDLCNSQLVISYSTLTLVFAMVLQKMCFYV